MKLNDYDQAIIAFSRAIMIDNTFAEAYNNRGNIYDDKKEYDKAISDFKNAIELRPANEIFYNNIAITLCEKRDYRKAGKYVETMKTLGFEVDPKIINILSLHKVRRWIVLATIVVYAISKTLFRELGLLYTLIYCIVAAVIVAFVGPLLYKIVTKA